MARAAITALVVAVLALGATACDSGEPRTAPTAPPTPLAQLNGTAMDIPRIDFCSLVPKVAIRQALAARRWDGEKWGNGDKADVAGTTDVVAEHGCRWRSSAGTSQAAAWVFAGPADQTLAHRVIRQSRTTTACHLVAGPTFGDPSLTQVCQVPGSVRVRHAGLFGDTWLTCEVVAATSVASVRARADAWCVEVANTLNTND
jgi:hypothetical protein